MRPLSESGLSAPPAHRPARDVLVALAIKLGLLAALYFAFFSPAHRPAADAPAVAGALLGSHTAEEPR